jgi:hypothetical protein
MPTYVQFPFCPSALKEGLSVFSLYADQTFYLQQHLKDILYYSWLHTKHFRRKSIADCIFVNFLSDTVIIKQIFLWIPPQDTAPKTSSQVQRINKSWKVRGRPIHLARAPRNPLGSRQKGSLQSGYSFYISFYFSSFDSFQIENSHIGMHIYRKFLKIHFVYSIPLKF